MGPKACVVPICVAALVAGCGSSSDAGETTPTTQTATVLTDKQREERIMEYLRLPQFDREVTDLITLVSVETATAKVVFEDADEKVIPYEHYCDAVLDSPDWRSAQGRCPLCGPAPRPRFDSTTST